MPTALMQIVIRVLMAADLNLASTALTPRYRRLRVVHVPPFPERHASDRHRSVGGLCLLNVYLTVINHSLVIVEVAIRRRLLKFPAQTLLRLGHRRDRRELLQQRVPPKGTLDRQRRVSRFHPAVFSLQHLDLLVEQILRQLVCGLQPTPLEHVAVADRALLKVTLLISGGLRLPTESLHHGAVALRLRVACRIVRVYLHIRGRIRGPVRVILVLHVGLAGDVRRRRQGRLAAGRVRAVHAVAVDLVGGRATMRRQRSLDLRRKAIDERRRRGVTQLKTRSDDLLLNGHHSRASRTLMHSGGSYHLIALVLSLGRADRHPVVAWFDHCIRGHGHCSSRKCSPFRGKSLASIRTHRRVLRTALRFNSIRR